MSISRLLAVGVAVVTATSVAAPAAHAAPDGDVSVAMEAPAEAAVGSAFDYRVTVQHVSGAKTSVTLTDTVPDGVTVQDVAVTRGTCSVSDSTVTCELPDVGPNGTRTVTISVLATAAGEWTNTATLAQDADAGNNSASATTAVADAPVVPQSASAPYDAAQHLGYAFADAADGRVEVVTPSGCPSDCGGSADVIERLTLSGTGQRTFEVDVDLHVVRAAVSPLGGAGKVIAYVTLNRTGDRHVTCITELVSATSPLPREDEALKLRCAWPDAVAGGESVAVQVGLNGGSHRLGQVDARTVVRAITVSGAAVTG